MDGLLEHSACFVDRDTSLLYSRHSPGDPGIVQLTRYQTQADQGSDLNIISNPLVDRLGLTCPLDDCLITICAPTVLRHISWCVQNEIKSLVLLTELIWIMKEI